MEFVGRAVTKEFQGFGVFCGTIQSFDPSSGFFYILYQDGDSEEMDLAEIKKLFDEGQEQEDEDVPLISLYLKSKQGFFSGFAPSSPPFDGFNTKEGVRSELGLDLKCKNVEKSWFRHSHDSNAGGSGDSSNVTVEYERGTCNRCLNPGFCGETKICVDYPVAKMNEHSACDMVEESKLKNVTRDNGYTMNSSREASGSDACAVIPISKCSMCGKPYEVEKESETGPLPKQGTSSCGKRQLSADYGIMSSRKKSSTTSTPHNVASETVSHVEDDPGMENQEGVIELPPKVSFPPSSINLDLEDIPVLDFFFLYSYLRSFSNVLFLSPFKLEDFLGALKCKRPTILFNSIHVCLLQTLKKHLEALSTAGCEASSSCLRDISWDLMDMITWPLFIAQYMLHSAGLKKKFDTVFFSNFLGDYYQLSSAVKIKMLLYLCNDALESESLRAELSRRCLISDSDMYYDRSANSENMKIKKDKIDVSGIEYSVDEDRNAMGDQNRDECCLCMMDGTLICCDGCPAAYHMKCVGVSEDVLPESEWYCPECIVDRDNRMKQKLVLRGAELLGIDMDGYQYFCCCEYLLVCHSSSFDSFCNYYHKNDVNILLQVLITSHTRYEGIINAISAHWSMPINSCPIDISLGSHTLIGHPYESLHDHTTVGDKKLQKSSVGSLSSSDLRLEVSDMTAIKTHVKAHNGDSETSGDCTGRRKEIPNFQNFYSRRGKTTTESAGLHITPKIGSHVWGKQRPCHYTSDYVNSYGFARVALTVAEELFNKSLDKVTKAGPSSVDDVISAQMTAIVKMNSTFCWKRFRNLRDNIWKEKCGWCFPCRSADGDQGCLFKKAVPAIENYEGMCSRLNMCEKGHLADVIHHILSMEYRLHGLLSGPWLNPHYATIWRKNCLTEPSLVSAKRMLLALELNIHHLAFCPDWSKYFDYPYRICPPSIVEDNSTITSSKQINGRRSRVSDVGPNLPSSSGLFWWRGGRLLRLLFNRMGLPRSMISKAARQAGHVKIAGILYSDNSDITKYNKRIAWRAAVEMSTSVEKFALQVRELNLQIKWDDIENTHDLSKLDNEFKKSASSFKKASIRKKSTSGMTVKYLIDFGKRKFIPGSVLKNGAFLQMQSDNKKKCWLEETYVPLHLIKAFEERTILRNSAKFFVGKTHEDVEMVKLSARKKDLSYLFTKAERPEHFDCQHCKMVLTTSEAVRCQYCEGLFHRRHVRKLAAHAKYVRVCEMCALEGYGPDPHGSRAGRRRSKCGKRIAVGPTKGRKQGRKLKAVRLKIPGRKRGRPRKFRLSNIIGIHKKRRTEKIPTYWLSGLRYSGKPDDERVVDFRRGNSAAFSLTLLPPVCRLCLTPGEGEGSLGLIRCQLCSEWFHGKAFGLREETAEKLIGFRCHQCRKKPSPECFAAGSHVDGAERMCGIGIGR